MGGEDVSPKNLGKIDIDDLLDELEVPAGFNSLWGSSGERSRRSVINTQGGVSRSSSTGCQFQLEFSRSNTLDMDSIVNQVSNTDYILEIHSPIKYFKMDKCNIEYSDENMAVGAVTTASADSAAVEHPIPHYIKIIIRETDDIDLFESKSVTVPKGSEEALAVEADNAAYDYLTIGKGKTRRTSEAEAQTANILYKSRSVNTDRVRTQQVGSYVSNFEMYDTFAELERTTQTLEEDNGNKIALTTYSVSGAHDDPDEKLA